MQTNKKIIISILLLSIFIIGCKKNDRKEDTIIIKDTANLKEQEDVSTTLNIAKDYANETFVISCGSGCAMNYTPEYVLKYITTIKVKFNVKMYIDEVLSDTYFETYIFYYDKNNELDSIKLEGKGENILKTLMPDAQDSFKNFGKKIALNNDVNLNDKPENSCIKPSNFKLPYNQSINIHTVKYNFLNCNSIKGIEKYNCGKDKLRYLSLPNKDNVNVILVPQDCGDFNYRYYLLTIKNNTVVGDLYVEGEWYEPENINDKEVTLFSIDQQYNIVVKTRSSEDTTSVSYILINDGKIVKKE
ncbi:hypothetical protein [Flavobacterium sp. ov086]|uniref:hypothetical protein n=1 Tax=Flavobacterium sp. ov086 TaxID=1761785 RepID=UPI000B692B2D|nr:hypothetical protein [Flavobacterium sp. ov086]SNR31301.1 hypothetical protein SAMN04487979_102254 [Flavobacterium sp. ov086]